MERRRSLRRANTAGAAAASPLSDHNTSPLRRQSSSIATINNIPDNDLTNSGNHRPPNFPLHRASNPPSSPSLHNHKSGAGVDSPHRHLHKQRSSEDLQTRLLWPSSKKLNPSDDAKSAAAASEDKKVDKGRRSLRHHIGKTHVERPLKKPGTPPSPSPASGRMHSGRLSFNVASLASKRSDFDVDFPSAESEQSESGGRASRARRPESPLKGKNGGVGSLISQGFSNLFRRKSFQGGGGSPGRERGVAVAVAAVADGEMQNKLRILHNYLIQWRFVNAGTTVVNSIKCDNSESTLVNAWLGLSNLCNSVAKKRMQLEKEKLKDKLNMLVCHQKKTLEVWGTMEKQHLASLSSTKDSLQAAVCRLPITDHAKVDPYLLSISLKQATNVATAINGNIAKCHSKAQRTISLVVELSEVVAKEKLLQEECIELLGLVSTLQIHEESLRSNLIQLKSQHLTRCALKGPSS